MTHPDLLSTSSLLKLINPSGVYLLGYAWLCGMSIWVSFLGGVIALKTLPRHQFGTLQHRTFPVYFVISILLASALLGLWAYGHPAVLIHWDDPKVADVAQAYTLAAVVLLQAGNYFVVGPMTSRVMFKRHKLEKEESKGYDESGVSDSMKTVNKQFSALHGASSLLNLCAVISLLFHGLWIGNAGVGIAAFNL
ncbi:hypothetical protein BKA93DRAFT_808756 [Sparassis latifolia]|uniref:TMEM205-like domain-containing protein n=1 Tax=Sparassis crispa TaxID=139825 RepID=A0A401G8C8_9APHY|nr:hypothetical protein SCP_0112850 [Sparassis crispa]GBE78398.1 hypothetical protein SCP_0112850 [Sparassis crispa]